MNPDIVKENNLCPICTSKSVYIFDSKHFRKIFRCSNFACRHLFTPIIREHQGVCSRNEDIELSSNESYNIYHERNLRLLNLFITKLGHRSMPLRFLDFGAGNAHISRSFKSELGLDCENLYSKYDLIQIKNINNVPVKVDFVYMIEVIEHLIDPISILKNMKSILNNNSILFISTPIGKNNETKTIAFDTPSHLHFFTKKSLNLTLKAAGYSEIKYKYYPEMYTEPQQNNLINSTLTYSRIFIKSFLAKTGLHIGHLVGFTKSL